MSYHLKHRIPDVETYIHIRLEAGLSRKSVEAASIGLSNGLCSIVVEYVPDDTSDATSSSTPVGIGRVIGDGGCFFEIVDIAVLPDHQGRGVGNMIMNALMTYIHNHAPTTAYVSLMADHHTPEFYTRYGFEVAKLPKSAGMFLRIS
ncbi:MAG: GNAT family N-acetyltransferase [Deinococcota bacterium]